MDTLAIPNPGSNSNPNPNPSPSCETRPWTLQAEGRAKDCEREEATGKSLLFQNPDIGFTIEQESFLAYARSKHLNWLLPDWVQEDHTRVGWECSHRLALQSQKHKHY